MQIAYLNEDVTSSIVSLRGFTANYVLREQTICALETVHVTKLMLCSTFIS